MDYQAEPWRVKVVEPIHLPDRDTRQRRLEEAGYNVFAIPAEDVYIDLLTDSGTAAMSQNQWAGIMLGDESYAGARNFYHFRDTVQQITGLPFIIPTHQGRVAENLLFSTLVRPGMKIPSNNHFDTTRANIEVHDGEAVDLVIPEGREPASDHPFKGNIDLDRLDAFLAENGREHVPVAMLTITNNSGGGQPVSLANIRGMSEICHRHGVPFFLDACRFAENAWFIKQREPGQAHRAIPDIVADMFNAADGCTMSAKKDGLANIGGFIGMRDQTLFENLKNMLILIEGFPTYGGLAGRDLEAVARGLVEALDERYLSFRVGQVQAFWQRLDRAGIPMIRPAGGHAVYIDAKSFLPHIPQDQFPAQALTVALYLEGGVRGVEIGGVMFGKTDPQTGEPVWPELELVRLAIPRRVYTNTHLGYVADVLETLYRNRELVRGLRMVYAAEVLRHFTARFAPVA
ncbi:MAG: tryptophanase [Acidobacteria bacterium]|nr:tryptophanase [Acidobacteriota bacterium]